MHRALKIVSRRRHANPNGSEMPPSGIIPARARRPHVAGPAIREPELNLESRVGVCPGTGAAPKERASGQTEQERIALETINRLMLTVSHYLSNPLTVLMGRVELLSEATENGGMSQEDLKKFTDSCKREINRIDLIIKVFQNLCEVRYKTFPPGIRMLDVEREIKDRLEEIEYCLRSE
jgi:signal transduction histidine kinase